MPGRCHGHALGTQPHAVTQSQKATLTGSSPPGLFPWFGEVTVEETGDRVPGEVLQDGVDDQLVGSGRPGRPRGEAPRSLFGADLRAADDASAVRSDHPEAPVEQAVVERPVESHLEWLEGAAGRNAQNPVERGPRGDADPHLPGTTARPRLEAGFPRHRGIPRRRPAETTCPSAAGSRPGGAAPAPV